MPSLFRFLSILCMAVLTLSACTEAGKGLESARKGMAAYRQGDYRKAFPLLEEAAGAGHPEAAWYVGNLYREGWGVEKNPGMACRRFLDAARGGVGKAYLPTAVCYRTGGEGFRADEVKALQWGEKAAKAAGESGQNPEEERTLAMLLGDLYFAGQGILHDYASAARWYEKAALLGDGKAQGILAFLAYDGKGMTADPEKARYWAEQAAKQDDDMGELVLGLLNQYREKPDVEQAVYWYKRASVHKNYAAQRQLANLYEKGIGVAPDVEKARYYYREAALNGRRDYLTRELETFETRQETKSSAVQ